MDMTSGMSMTKHEERARIKTFAGFRVSGDALVPAKVTKLLGYWPSISYKKGEKYSAGHRTGTLIGRTGVWYLSTEKIISSEKLVDHLMFVVFVLGLIPSSASEDMLRFRVRKIGPLHQLIRAEALRASLICFWHGPTSMKPPKLPTELVELFKLLEIEIDLDFENDEGSDETTHELAV
jgi:hypothetical protein